MPLGYCAWCGLRRDSSFNILLRSNFNSVFATWNECTPEVNMILGKMVKVSIMHIKWEHILYIEFVIAQVVHGPLSLILKL